MYRTLLFRLRRHLTLRAFTTKVLVCIFSAGLLVFSVIAIVVNPGGMLGNIVSEMIGLCLAALVIELLLVARDEQSKNDFEQQQNTAVGLSISEKTDEGRSITIFLNSFIISKIKEPSLWLRFKDSGSESMTSVALTQGEFSAFDLVANPLITEEALNKAIRQCRREPDEIVVKWIDQRNVSRERSWSMKHLRTVQDSLKGRHAIFSASL